MGHHECTNRYMMEVPGEERREENEEKMLKEMMAENFANLLENNLHIQEA